MPMIAGIIPCFQEGNSTYSLIPFSEWNPIIQARDEQAFLCKGLDEQASSVKGLGEQASSVKG